MKASVYIATTLDGFIARKNGALDWLPGSDGNEEMEKNSQEDFGFNDFIDSVDVLIMGRSTYEQVLSFGAWPYGTKRVMVLSRTLIELSGELPETVKLSSCAPAELIVELQQSGAEHVYIDGGKTIQGFLTAGLVDEIIITVVPILIGEGIPLFGPLNKDLKFKLLEATSFKNGFVQNRYRVLK